MVVHEYCVKHATVVHSGFVPTLGGGIRTPPFLADITCEQALIIVMTVSFSSVHCYRIHD